MLFASDDRYQYVSSPLIEVICQLRFPAILTIGAKEPAEFQESVRADFPRYVARQEQQAPRVVNGKVEQPPAVTNYNFISADGLWKINLTHDFVALSTLRYANWEDFAQRLDKVLASFIQLYRPAFFERIGLRYVNAFSRKELALEDVSFRELIADRYLGIFADDELAEQSVARSTVDGDIATRGGCRAKIHAGPGMVKRGNVQDTEVKFIFDQDLFMPGKIPVNLSTAALSTLHAQGWAIFRDAITAKLHEAMEP